MGKAFSEHEIESIRQKLFESCRFCWEKYGYKKTSVAEIAARSGISTGAFYAFYPSKEMLFVETSDYYGKAIFDKITAEIPENSTKYDLANCLKKLMREVTKNPWMLSFRNDAEIFMRKLPPDYWEKNRQKDLIDYEKILSLIHYKPKISLDDLIAVISTISVSLYFPELIGENREKALDFIIDAIVEKL